MKEYNVLIDFFKKRDDKEIIEFLIKSRDEYHKKIKERGEEYILDISPKRRITQKEYRFGRHSNSYKDRFKSC